MSIEGEPHHPIIDKPWEYDIAELRYHVDPEDWRASFVDLHLRKGTVVRRLRFVGPQNLEIEAGFPHSTGGLCILDIRKRQWEGLAVEVADFEGNSGAITFVARNVVDLDTEDDT
jgi:hypothetical protein